jgi:hypothetical protein
MTTTHNRRQFFKQTLTAGGAALAPSLIGLTACSDLEPAGPDAVKNGSLASLRRADRGYGGYGALVPSSDVPELAIPEDFRVVKLSRTATPSLADSSFIVPNALDGMAALPMQRSRGIRLVRNHEIRDTIGGPYAVKGSRPYDGAAGGGTTTLEVHPTYRGRRVVDVELTREFVSLSGTSVNCAGGPTPWGSWITCEETTSEIGEAHGYAFDVLANADGEVTAVPLRGLGRFVHEALAIDPRTGFVYETEDRSYDPADEEANPGSGFFRFIPERDGDMTRAGRLQVLAIKGRPQYDTTTGQRVGKILPVHWVDIDDVDPDNAAADPSAVFRQGLHKGAARFQRLEGCWFGDHSVFFNATSGGDAGAGQVWQYRPLGSRRGQLHGSGGQLILVFESPDFSVLDSPDNICVSPRGGVVLCEDGNGVQFMRGLTRRGEIFDLVSHDGTEFAGATFSPDGQILFFNVQGSTSSTGTTFGGTFALWGPWEQGAL